MKILFRSSLPLLVTSVIVLFYLIGKASDSPAGGRNQRATTHSAADSFSYSPTGQAFSNHVVAKPFSDAWSKGIFPPLPTDSIELAFVNEGLSSAPGGRYLTSSHEDSQTLGMILTRTFMAPLSRLSLTTRGKFEKTKDFEKRKAKALESVLASVQKSKYSITLHLGEWTYDPDTETLAKVYSFPSLGNDFIRIDIPDECTFVKATTRYYLSGLSARDAARKFPEFRRFKDVARKFPEFRGFNYPPTAKSQCFLRIEVPMDTETAKIAFSDPRSLRLTFSASLIPEYSVYADPSWAFANWVITDTRVTGRLLIFHVQRIELFSLKEMATVLHFSSSIPNIGRLSTAIVAKDYSTFMQQIEGLPKFSFSLDHAGKNLFHYLAKSGNPETIAKAMEKCANGKEAINAHMIEGGEDGPTPLIIACSAGNFAAANALLELGADPNISYLLGDSSVSPLSTTIQQGNMAFVSKLLKFNATPDLDSLCSAVYSNQRDLVELFLSTSSLSANSMDEYSSPLISAIMGKNPDMVKFLISAGADVNRFPDVFPSPLFLAMEKGLGNIVFLLIESGADVNFASFASGGETPLHLAVRRADYELMKKLLRSKARRDLKDRKGQSPFDLAKRIGDQTAMEILSSP